MKNLKKLLEELPPIIGRKSIDKLLPGVIDPRHLANLDSKGLGPKKTKFGKHVFYRRDDFIEWFVERVERTESKYRMEQAQKSNTDKSDGGDDETIW